MITDAAHLPPSVDLHALIALFYEQSAELGVFAQQAADQLPEAYRHLLAHHGHMTVTVENYHQSLVDVHVHRTRLDDNLYAREITLSRCRDQHVVQYGIVRLDRECLKPPVWEEIVSEKIPLGRVLIEHDVLREVVLQKLWRVECGASLAKFLNVVPGTVVFGRTAMIFCDNQPAIELLEIVVA